jgi:hypothetical protein
VTLLFGTRIVYGRAVVLSSIDELWAHVPDVDTNGECRPRCGPGGGPRSVGKAKRAGGSNVDGPRDRNEPLRSIGTSHHRAK